MSHFYCREQGDSISHLFRADSGRRLATRTGPLGPLGVDFCQHGPTTRPSVERTAQKAFLLPDRFELAGAEASVNGIVSGSVGVFEIIQDRIAPSHTPNPSQPFWFFRFFMFFELPT
jgi:hypothetical protein